MSPRTAVGVALGEAAMEWTRTRRVTVDGWSVRYREAGEGLPIVLAHGLGVSADYWIRNGPPLAAAGFRVLAPDLPGFGHTPGPRGGLSVEEQAEALTAWAGMLGLPPAVWVGHSLAAQAVLEIADRWPDRTGGLVLASPTGAPGWRLTRQLLGLIRDVRREPLALVPIVVEAYLRAGIPRVWRTWRLGTRHDPSPLLAAVRVPALVLAGTRDPVVIHAFAESLAAGMPLGEITWVEGGGHAVHFDRAAEFNLEVARFARGVANRAGLL